MGRKRSGGLMKQQLVDAEIQAKQVLTKSAQSNHSD
jgi:hypothetical protein